MSGLLSHPAAVGLYSYPAITHGYCGACEGRYRPGDRVVRMSDATDQHHVCVDRWDA